ncbi:c-type cytochrome [Cellvibrio polysaccharolyticus]|uniref:Cytochrome c n=1 Tax=Cellvibrio polysaccharolyticus TaxID=2082724 RepID=A0A928YU46_9GAMM|nr:cytochrome c [Cellvibrio polysaccharolyticus]MBE8718256.1 cytochrome c [Cellvibrio polysaccharolyticus]
MPLLRRVFNQCNRSVVLLAMVLPAAHSLADDVTAGKAVYQKNCQACHQPTGAGIKGAFPPLADNPNIKDNPEHIANSILKGQSGHITVNGDSYNGMMPPLAHLSDENIADVVAFILAEWNESKTTLSAADIKALR